LGAKASGERKGPWGNNELNGETGHEGEKGIAELWKGGSSSSIRWGKREGGGIAGTAKKFRLLRTVGWVRSCERRVRTIEEGVRIT